MVVIIRGDRVAGVVRFRHDGRWVSLRNALISIAQFLGTYVASFTTELSAVVPDVKKQC